MSTFKPKYLITSGVCGCCPDSTLINSLPTLFESGNTVGTDGQASNKEDTALTKEDLKADISMFSAI